MLAAHIELLNRLLNHIHAGIGGSGLAHAFGGDIHAGDLPAAMRQIEGIPSLPHTDIQRAPGRKHLRSFDEKRIGLRGVEVRFARVNLVPTLCFSHRRSGAIAGGHVIIVSC